MFDSKFDPKSLSKSILLRCPTVVMEHLLSFVTFHYTPESVVIYDITAIEIVAVAASVLSQCPSCGAEAWVNIDCELCMICSGIAAAVSDCDHTCEKQGGDCCVSN